MNPLFPQELLIKIGIGVLIVVLTGAFSFIGGCSYKERSYANERVAASEKARSLEKADEGMSHRKMEQLAEDKVLISDAHKMVDEALKNYPKVIVEPDCVAKIAVVGTPKSKDYDNAVEKIEQAKFSSDFTRLYDLSISTGDAELRGRLNGPAPEIEVTTGAGVIENNAITAAEIRLKLKRLQERICEKQKTFNQPQSKYCHS
jgi:hypothetical protein